MSICKLLVLLCLALVAFGQQGLTNEAIVKMAKAGLSESVILSVISGQPGRYSTTVEDLISLKQAGVSDRVIAAMVGRGEGSPTQVQVGSANGCPAEPGVFARISDRWIRMDPASTSSETAVTGRFVINATHTEVLLGPSAGPRLDEKPQFCLVRHPDVVQEHKKNPLRVRFDTDALQQVINLYRLEAGEGDRKLKFGAILQAKNSSRSPTIDLSLIRDTEADYTFGPVSELLPGEYALQFLIAGRQTLFDFGVGAPATPVQPTSSDGYGRVFVFRERGQILKPSIFVDDEEVLRLPSGSYCELKVRPGRHAFHIRHLQRDPLRLTIMAGRTYYLQGKQKFGGDVLLEVPKEAGEAGLLATNPVDPQLVSRPEAVASTAERQVETAAAAGKYVIAGNKNEVLNLVADGSFALSEAGKHVTGTYVVRGKTLVLDIHSGKKTLRSSGQIDGGAIVDSEGKRWVRE